MKPLDFETKFEPIRKHRRNRETRTQSVGFRNRVPRHHCPVTGKIRFGSQRHALIRAGELKMNGWSAYRCAECGSWHLTSNK